MNWRAAGLEEARTINRLSALSMMFPLNGSDNTNDDSSSNYNIMTIWPRSGAENIVCSETISFILSGFPQLRSHVEGNCDFLQNQPNCMKN